MIVQKTVVIMRGLPGSGKTTKAKELVITHKPKTSVICSADNFFISKDGTYKFNHHKLHEAHQYCLSTYKRAIKQNIELIIVDNTMTRFWEAKKYIQLAMSHGYCLDICNLFDGGLSVEDLASRNEHGVPVKSILNMKNRYESQESFSAKAIDCLNKAL